MDEHILEMAEKAQAARLQHAIDNRVQYQGESAADCQDCGADIPEGRRLAVPGVQFCIGCQQVREPRR